MKRFLAFILLTGLLPAPVYALGLGKLDLKSGLNEPFEATIELLSPTRDELDSVALRLADAEAFERAGIDRPFVLSQLRFEVQESESGPDRVRVYSREAIREPFLNFLVEANWSHGRLFREYTVLLDPPLYAAGTAAMRKKPVVTSVVPQGAEQVAEEAPAAPVSGGAPEGAPGGYAGGDYGPTTAGDTLWSIAGRTRPDANTTVQQMMLALVRANPEAFASSNVNGLKRGQILHMPSQEELATVSPADAFAQVKAQYAAWQQAGGSVPKATPERPVGAETAAEAEAQPAPAAPAPAPAEGKSELKLVAPTKQRTGVAQGGRAASATGAAEGKQTENQALANEQVESLSQENLELKDRLNESQTIIGDLKRLIALKDDELAAMQKKLAAGETQPPAQAVAKPAAAPAGTPEEAAPAKTVSEAAPPAAAPAAAAPGEAAPASEQPKKQEAAPRPKPAAAEKPAPAKTAPPPAPFEPYLGLLQKIPAIITGNLQLVAMVGGGLIVFVVLVLVVARRRRRAADEGETVALEFPDFKGAEAETILPGAEEEEEEIEVERAAPAPAAVAKAPPKAKPEAAPARAAAPAAEPAAAPQEDPLAEVNVFLAYEHFDQAEEFVRDAITREPDNLDFHVKLLEVLSAANERKKYEDAAKVLQDKVNGTGAYWESALFYWDAMSPGRALFAAPVAGEEEAPAAAAGGGMLDLTAGESAKAASADMSLDFDLGEATAAPAPKAAAVAREEEVLDITAGTEGVAQSAAPAPAGEDVLDVTAAVGLDAIE